MRKGTLMALLFGSMFLYAIDQKMDGTRARQMNPHTYNCRVVKSGGICDKLTETQLRAQAEAQARISEKPFDEVYRTLVTDYRARHGHDAIE